MSQFTGPLTITEVDVDLELWKLEQDLTYEVGHLGSGDVITVPSGFISDGASIPWFITWWLPRWGRYRRAAIVHDWLGRLLRDGTPHAHAPTKRTQDAVFWEALGVLDVNPVLRVVLWAGARVGSVFPWIAAAFVRN